MPSQKPKPTRAPAARFSTLAVVSSAFLGAVLGLAVGFTIGQRTPTLPGEQLTRVKLADPKPGNPEVSRMAVQGRQAVGPVEDI